MRDRCKHQREMNGAYYCKVNIDGIGPCLGLCGRYEPANKDLPPTICPKCHQHLTAEESLNQFELEKGQLLQFIRRALDDGFVERDARALLEELDY